MSALPVVAQHKGRKGMSSPRRRDEAHHERSWTTTLLLAAPARATPTTCTSLAALAVPWAATAPAAAGITGSPAFDGAARGQLVHTFGVDGHVGTTRGVGRSYAEPGRGRGRCRRDGVIAADVDQLPARHRCARGAGESVAGAVDWRVGRDDGRVERGITVHAASDNPITPAQARELAAVLVQAAEDIDRWAIRT